MGLQSQKETLEAKIADLQAELEKVNEAIANEQEVEEDGGE